MQNIFPSITGLRAFEAAARYKSFTRAAIELNLTQSAVSHQIRKLEDLIGMKLFERLGNDIQLLEAGTAYYTVARAIITELRTATDRVMSQGKNDVLSVGSLGTFAVKCLIPNLSDFIEQNPDIMLRLKILPATPDPDFGDCDVSILYGNETDWPRYNVTRITSEELFPVCSPMLLRGSSALSTPGDLVHQTMIRTVSPFILRDDWPFWLTRAGVPDLGFKNEITCDLLSPSYQLAIEGVGVALGRSAVVAEDVRNGLLVEPFSVRIVSGAGYHIVSPPQLSSSKVERFTRWADETFK